MCTPGLRLYTVSDWDQKSKSEASSLLGAITEFSFIVTFMLVYKYLSHLEGITRLLQSTSLDILKAYDEAGLLKNFYLYTMNIVIKYIFLLSDRGNQGHLPKRKE